LFSLSEIAKLIGSAMPEGVADFIIESIKSPEQASNKDITFLSNSKYKDSIKNCNCGVVIVKKNDFVESKVCLIVDDPYTAYAQVAQLFEDKSPLFNEGISSQAIIDPTASVDPTCSIGPGTVIGPKVKIAKNCRIGARVVIERNTTIGESCRIDSGVVIRWETVIGAGVVVQSGAIIGSDGFGNARQKDGSWIRIPGFGNVIIGDNAEIGAGATIDRGNFEPTVIENGAKLDNLVHIAHNVTVGENTAIAAQTGVSGSTKIGKRVLVGGQAGFVGHITIGDDTFIGAKAGVSKDIEPGSKITGYPARDLMTMRRIEAAQSNLPALLKEIKQIQKKLSN
jgi:UDP-3-O-[3-hydroxymyristoyl] glucosamine N-acyltransferase